MLNNATKLVIASVPAKCFFVFKTQFNPDDSQEILVKKTSPIFGKPGETRAKFAIYFASKHGWKFIDTQTIITFFWFFGMDSLSLNSRRLHKIDDNNFKISCQLCGKAVFPDRHDITSQKIRQARCSSLKQKTTDTGFAIQFCT